MLGNPRGLWSSSVAIALAIFLGANTAAAAERQPPVVVGGQYPAVTFSTSIRPRTLSKTESLPIKLGLRSQFFSTDGFAFPPALRRMRFLLDRHLELSTRGLPACAPRLQLELGNPVAERCEPSLVGGGEINVFFAPPESKGFAFQAKALLYNGGTRAGVTLLWIYAPLTASTPGAILLTPVRLKKVDSGAYGTEALISTQGIADEYGRTELLSLRISREYEFKGEHRSVATFRCANGKLQASAEATFLDGAHAAAPAVRPCSIASQAKPR